MQNTINNRRIKTEDLILIPLFTALIAVGAFIKIPIGVVPISLQFVFCALAGLILGSKKGFLSVLIYLMIGLVGIPIFTKGGGPQYVLYPSFGYLIGFLLASFVIGYLSEKFSSTNIIKLFFINFIGLIVVYTIGVLYLFAIMKFYNGTPMAFTKAIKVGALAFILGDTIWCIVAALVASRINTITNNKYRK